MTREEAFAEINSIQDSYVNELANMIIDPNYSAMKCINFTSPTGTGKTKMMSKLIKRCPEYFYVITTLSRGQLNTQVRTRIHDDLKDQNNYIVYGSADYRINSKLEAEDIISQIPDKSKCIWIRDEGHIKTNRFEELLIDVCFKVINFSATNVYSDITCNFTQTMMLRTVNQTCGTPKDAINKLMEIKRTHKKVSNYNPCAIFRCVSGDDDLYEEIIKLCKSKNLSYIDVSEETYNISELCADDNDYDVIINKYKIVEGIDIRRAHVLYMDNQPANNSTSIQAIGRCRRNALLYRDDIDILSPDNIELLINTRECYVFYNVQNMKIPTGFDGELQYAFCNHVSCEALKDNTTIDVVNGQLANGLYVIELENCTGKYQIAKDSSTGFNVVLPLTDFYNEDVVRYTSYVYAYCGKIKASNISKLPLHVEGNKLYYLLEKKQELFNVKYDIPESFVSDFNRLIEEYDKDYFNRELEKYSFDRLIINSSNNSVFSYSAGGLSDIVDQYLEENFNLKSRDYKSFVSFLENINGHQYTTDNHVVSVSDILDEYGIALLKYYCVQIRKAKVFRENIMHNEILSVVDMLLQMVADEPAFRSHSNEILVVLFDYYGLSKLSKESGSLEANSLCIIDYVREMPRFTAYKTCSGKIKLSWNELLIYNDKWYAVFWGNKTNTYLYYNCDKIVNDCIAAVEKTHNNICNGIIDCVVVSCDKLFEKYNDDEQFLSRNNLLNSKRSYILESELKSIDHYCDYIKICNDIESAIIGVDTMQQIRFDNDETCWIESKSVTSKIGKFNKLNGFISSRYKVELELARSQCFTGKNTFDLDSKCNSMIGYCVEYYSKNMVYGESYLADYLSLAQKEVGESVIDDHIIVRACMLKYKAMMVRSFGVGVGRLIRGIPADKLVQTKYDYFVDLIVSLGKRTAEYVKANLYPDGNPVDNIDPNLTVRHISGLADYITTDTILDVKVKNFIDEKDIRQILAYHYLSTKRSDLKINRVIVYDAVSNKSVEININNLNV